MLPLSCYEPYFATKDTALEYLIEQKVLVDKKTCDYCKGNVTRKGALMRCTSRNCRKSKSIFDGTIFSNLRIDSNKLLRIAHYHLAEVKCSSIATITGMSKVTLRSVLKEIHILLAPSPNIGHMKIGGPGIIVEIDESKFGKVKYNKGHRVEGVWIFGGVEHTTQRRLFLEAVPNRKKETLEEVLLRKVELGTIIYSDGWKGYSNLKNIGYQHMVVNHSKHFLDPLTGVHTNTVEGTWCALKSKTPIRNRTEALVEQHLETFIWKRENKSHMWEAFSAEYLNILLGDIPNTIHNGELLFSSRSFVVLVP